jgi:hypothetical protein
MKAVKSAVFSVSMLLSLAMVSDAFAHGAWGHRHHRHSGVRLGVVVGVPAPWYYSSPRYYPPYYPPYPYPYYPPTVVVPAEPREYIEQGQTTPTPSAPASAYWHYCAESRAYYPYVKECAGPWQRVAPRPPPS